MSFQSRTSSIKATTSLETRKSTSTEPDIHPELTLEQIKKPVELNIRKKMKKHSNKNQELDINTMFDFHSRLGLKTLGCSSALVTTSTLNAERTTSKPAASARRSSIAVIGAERQRKKDYFETHHLNLHSSRFWPSCLVSFLPSIPLWFYKRGC